MPLEVPPPRTSRFGSPLVLNRVHWVKPELVAEVRYLTWTDDNLLRQVVYEGLREDKPATEVRREAFDLEPQSTITGRVGGIAAFRDDPLELQCAGLLASTARNSSWLAGPIPKDGGRGSAHCCSPTTIRMEGWSRQHFPSVAACARPRARRLGKSKAVAGGQGRNGGRSIG
jgi:hypothetical protein